MTAVPETARVEAIAAVLGEHVIGPTYPAPGSQPFKFHLTCGCGLNIAFDDIHFTRHRAHLAAALAALLDGERAAGWEACVKALAWCLDNGPAGSAPGYLLANNPYRVGEVGGA